ncbi:MAG: TolC family protein [Gemmatimonadales bacterium]
MLRICRPVLALAMSVPVSAQAPADTMRLTLPQSRVLAFRANPELIAARQDIAVARGELRQARLIFQANPSVEIFADGASGNGTEAVFSQEVEIFGQQSARSAAGRAGVERASAGAANTARLTVGESDRLFYRLIAAARRAKLAGEVLDLSQRLTDVVRRQLEAGEVSGIDFNLATVELGRSQARALAARRDRDRVMLDLARILGMPPETFIIPVWDSTARAPSGGDVRLNVDSLTVLALARRPDIAEREAAARQASGKASAAAREALPNLSLRVLSERNAAGTERSIRPGFGLTVPLFNRNRGTVEALRALAHQADLERAALVSRVRAGVARAVRDYETAVAGWTILEHSVLPSARKNRRLLETAYREGEVGLPVLLLIRNQVVEAELEYWGAWLAAREALADLAETTGENLPSNVLENRP